MVGKSVVGWSGVREGGDVDVVVTMRDRGSYSHTKRGRLSSTTSCGERHSTAECLFHDCVDEGQKRFRLVDCLGELDQIAYRRRIC